MNQNMFITQLAIDQVHPNPENPRKNLGDLSELTESIKKNGIMQNLTVYPADDSMEKFTVLIGHRRLAAAKAAGLSTVPCRILPEAPLMREQMAIMLEENMQRNDLTIQEEAQGFQMMLDLGFNVDEIAKKTGFSKSTIHHRLNLAKLDQEGLSKKLGVMQLSLTDLYELERIPDIEARDEILKNATSSNGLKWAVDQWMERKAKKEWLDKARDLLIRKGVKQKTQDMKAHWEQYDVKTVGVMQMSKGEPELPKGTDADCYYEITEWNYTATIFRAKRTDKAVYDKMNEQRIAAQKAKNIIDQRWAELKKSMADFARWLYRNAGTKEMKDDEDTYTYIRMAMRGYAVSWSYVTALLAQKEAYQMNEEEKEEWIRNFDDKPMKLVAIISMTKWAIDQQIIDYRGHFEAAKGEIIRSVVSIMEDYGFAITAEQRAVICGKHDAYIKGESNA